MYIGIDLGTSGVKAILLSEKGEVLATQTEKLHVSRPHPLWSEQDPEQWWQATDRALIALGEQHSLQDVKALGIAGQMHGATLLDNAQRVLRPAILWNDGRCAEECAILEERVPTSREITGNLMMPGFTAPKLLWVQRHEPEIFRQVDKVLLPKDYLRFRMTGVFASDMSDAAGTMWLDVAKRDWSEAMLDACQLTRDHMPALFEGSEITGTLQSSIAARWNLPVVPAPKPEALSLTVRLGINAALAIRDVLLDSSEQALADRTRGELTQAFRDVVDAIIAGGGMVGGLGERYTRVAAAHAVHNGLTVLPQTEKFLHGTKVAYGILVQSALLGQDDVLAALIAAYQRFNLPTTLRELDVDIHNRDELDNVIAHTLRPVESIHYLPVELSPEVLRAAFEKVEVFNHSAH